jgi:hypothetical protein
LSKSLQLPAWSVMTSTQGSRLVGHILPLFKAKTGIDVKVVAQGTDQALNTGRRGERRRCVRPRQIGGGEIPGGRLRRQAIGVKFDSALNAPHSRCVWCKSRRVAFNGASGRLIVLSQKFFVDRA